MEYINIPACALNRTVGTVLVSNKMEVSTSCCQREVCPGSECPESTHRPSGCELCRRTRLVNQYGSDCDSGVVEKCRPYRSSAARSRYINVCAAVCLLLLVGGLSPQSSAAPHRSRASMERQKRAAGSSESRLWGNPCDYNDSSSKVSHPPEHATELMPKLVAQSRNVRASSFRYKDVFAKMHSYPNFEDLLHAWESYEWLRKFTWFREEVLPKEKVLTKNVSDEYMNQLLKKIDEILPTMYKALKMIVAGLYTFSKEGLNDNIISDENLKENIIRTMHDVRAVLCYFSDIMKARNLEILPLLDSEIPDFKMEDKLSIGLLVYRDTLNYLEYLEQVFQKLQDVKTA